MGREAVTVYGEFVEFLILENGSDRLKDALESLGPCSETLKSESGVITAEKTKDMVEKREMVDSNVGIFVSVICLIYEACAKPRRISRGLIWRIEKSI